MALRKVLVVTGALAAAFAAPSAAAAAELSRPHVTWLRGEGNYTKAHRGPAAIDYLVVHVTEGSLWGSVRWLQNEQAHASSHYVVGRNGKILQLVHDSDIAWHAGNWRVNARSIGIEHEGFVDDPRGFTAAEYRASARLAAYVARRSVMPIDRTHLIGHAEVPDPFRAGRIGGYDHHTDPGPHWNWRYYLKLVRRFAQLRRVVPLRVRSSVAPRALLDGTEPWAARTTRGVTRVEFRVDGRLVWRDHRAPYGHRLNTALLRNGRHVLEVRAIPRRGKIALERTAVRIRNRTFDLTTAGLHDGQNVRGVLRVRANVRGARSYGITLSVDGRPVSRDPSRPFSLQWDSRRVPDGRHTLELVARAKDGRVARRTVRVLVSNRPVARGAAPKVLAQSLGDGNVVSGQVRWEVRVSGSVMRVEFLVDGVVRGAVTERPLALMWDTTVERPGEHVVTARAVARDGRTHEQRVRVTVAPAP